MSVHSRHESVDVTLQGRTPKNTRTGVQTDIGSCGDRLSRPPVLDPLASKKTAALTVLMLNLSDCGFAMSFFSPAKHARVGCRLPPVLFLCSFPRDFRGITRRTANHSTLTPQPYVVRCLMLATQLLSPRFVGSEKPLISVQRSQSACHNTQPCCKEQAEQSFISQSAKEKCLIRPCLHRRGTSRQIARLAFLRQSGEPSSKRCHD